MGLTMCTLYILRFFLDIIVHFALLEWHNKLNNACNFMMNVFLKKMQLIWDCGGGVVIWFRWVQRVFSNSLDLYYVHVPFNVLIMSCTCPLVVYLKIIPYVTDWLIRSPPVYFLKIIITLVSKAVYLLKS